jgi:hypothetical protein
MRSAPPIKIMAYAIQPAPRARRAMLTMAWLVVCALILIGRRHF